LLTPAEYLLETPTVLGLEIACPLVEAKESSLLLTTDD